jgi:hypothetical protein
MRMVTKPDLGDELANGGVLQIQFSLISRWHMIDLFGGRHNRRQLSVGHIVNLTKHQGADWAITSIEVSNPLDSFVNPIVAKGFSHETVQAEDLGWQDLRFEAADDAYDFAAEWLKKSTKRAQRSRAVAAKP